MSSVAFSTGEFTGQKQCFRKISVVIAHKRLREDERQEEKLETALIDRIQDSDNDGRDKRRIQDIPQGTIESRRKGACSSS